MQLVVSDAHEGLKQAIGQVLGSSPQRRHEAKGQPPILVREVLPNAAPPVIVDYALRITYGIIFVSTLSFLGFGAQPPSSNWGLMVAESRSFLSVSPWATLAPALGIAALSIAFTLVGDALTRHLSREAEIGMVPL